MQGAVPPRDFQGLKSLITARSGDLPKRLNQIAAYALEHPEEIAFGTVASIAAQARVQPSSLVRFAQAMGYQGFSELQDVFRARLRDRVLNYEERLAQLRSHDLSTSQATVLFEGFSDAAAKSLRDLKERVEPAQLDLAVQMLAKAETLYLLGLRRSFPVTCAMAYALSKLGIPHRLIDGLAGLSPEVLNFATPRDALIAVSFAPYASETVELTAEAARREVPVIAITDSTFSPLVRHASLWFEVAEANFEGFRALAATITLAMTLTVALAEVRTSERNR